MDELEKAIRAKLPEDVEVTRMTHESLLSGESLPKHGGVCMTIVKAGELSKRALRIATATFRHVSQQRGESIIVLHVGGYDNDPRELYKIPELCAWLAQFCSKCGLYRPEDVANATGIEGGNDWILACVAAHEGALVELGDGKFRVLWG